tara:strand:- start:198 stop:872 length:675 start_codon:yes stop_codon:yes gene_type:complete
MISLIIIDFDDTIVENSELDYQSFKSTSMKFGVYYPSKKELRLFRHKKIKEKEIIKLIELKSNKKIKEYSKFRKRFLESYESTRYLKLRPFLKNNLVFLKNKKMKIFIFTLRKNKKNIQRFLIDNNIDELIDGIETAKKIDTKNEKIAISEKMIMFDLIKKKNKLNSNNLISIGDSFVDAHVANKFKVRHFSINIENFGENEINFDNFKELKELLTNELDNNLK